MAALSTTMSPSPASSTPISSMRLTVVPAKAMPAPGSFGSPTAQLRSTSKLLTNTKRACGSPVRSVFKRVRKLIVRSFHRYWRQPDHSVSEHSQWPCTGEFVDRHAVPALVTQDREHPGQPQRATTRHRV